MYSEIVSNILNIPNISSRYLSVIYILKELKA